MASLPRQGHTCHLNPDNGGTPGTASVMSVLCHAWKLKDDPEPIPHEGYLIMKKRANDNRDDHKYAQPEGSQR